MDNKGFTLIELLATLIVLGVVVGITFGVVNFNLDKTKEKTEEVFVDTLRDAVDMYLSSNFGKLKVETECTDKLSKKHGSVTVYKVTKSDDTLLTFKDIIEDEYHSLTNSDFVNPANENLECNVNAIINVYRDEDFVYYYSIDKAGLACLKNIDEEYNSVISNLPEGYNCR